MISPVTEDLEIFNGIDASVAEGIGTDPDFNANWTASCGRLPRATCRQACLQYPDRRLIEFTTIARSALTQLALALGIEEQCERDPILLLDLCLFFGATIAANDLTRSI